ncbi:MAG: insulinase family protein [Oscillatoria sp. SIO1A7]|nr:insulinase family protein [Oscillatoria sp. SIO1A7]
MLVDVNQTVTKSLQSSPIHHRTVLKNGMTVIAVENSAADIIAARIFIRAGGRWEPTERAGLSHLLAAVMTKGTEGLSSLKIAEQVESVGASLGTDSTPDYFLLSLKTVSADFADLLRLCYELLRQPTFPEAEVELERRLTLQGIRSQQEQPFSVAFEQLRQAMYSTHPYGFSPLGTETTVASIDRADLQDYHQTYFRPDNIVVSIAGRLAPEEAIALVEEIFGNWESPQTPRPTLDLPPVLSAPKHLCTPQDTQQSVLMLGYLVPPVGSHSQPPYPMDYATLKLLNTYLGNGLSSRLFVELREKRGLAYDVSAFYPTRLDTAMFVAYMGTAPENTETALLGLRQEIERLCNTELSADELQAAKNKLLGQYALGKQTNAQIAQVLGWYEILGLGTEFDVRFAEAIASITPAMAQAVACRYFTQPYVSLVGPSSAIEGLEV